MARRKAESTSKFDPRDGAVVLAYVGGPHTAGAPRRDLSGGDLARILYVRKLNAARATLDLRRKPGDDRPPSLKRPTMATSDELGELAAALVATGSYRDPATVDAAPEPED